MRAEINTGKDRFAAFESRYRIDVIKKIINRKIYFFAQPYITYCMHAHSFKAALIAFLVTSCLNWRNN